MKSPCVVFSANRGYALTSSRTGLIRRFLDKGWIVVLATADDDESAELCRLGAHLEAVEFRRRAFSPVSDLRTYYRLCEIFRTWRPVLVQNFHAKPVILGSLAARRIRKSDVRIVNVITGLGSAVESSGIASLVGGHGYKLAGRHSDIVIFQNDDDRVHFVDRYGLEPDKTRCIIGSGVDTEQISYVDRTKTNRRVVTVLLLARLLRQKGITEFCEVAESVRARYPEVRFVLAGEPESLHRDCVSPEWIRSMEVVDYVGHVADVKGLLRDADIFLFPSYYREGLPRVVLEASASGLPTVAFDVPGVREVVWHGKTGFLAARRDVHELETYLRKLIEDPVRRLEMGKAARGLVEARFDIKQIEKEYVDVYRGLGVGL